MHHIATLALASALWVAACASLQPAPPFDPSAVVQYWVDFGGAGIPSGDGQDVLSVGGWSSDFACAYRPDHTQPDALRFDDSRVPGWDQARDGGTPPPMTRGGAGVALRVEPVGKDSFAVSLGFGGKTYTGTASADAAAVGFHYVGYATPPELLAIAEMRLVAGDGSSLTLSGTASFPMDCSES